MKDITTEADVRLLVDAFYAAVREDQLLNPIFADVAQIDWTHHLPRMYRFWNAQLLGKPGYVGQPFAAHMELPVTREHFVRWLEVFRATVDRHFVGEGAKRAKDMAASFAHALAMRLGMLDTMAEPML